MIPYSFIAQTPTAGAAHDSAILGPEVQSAFATQATGLLGAAVMTAPGSSTFNGDIQGDQIPSGGAYLAIQVAEPLVAPTPTIIAVLGKDVNGAAITGWCNPVAYAPKNSAYMVLVAGQPVKFSDITSIQISGGAQAGDWFRLFSIPDWATDYTELTRRLTIDANQGNTLKLMQDRYDFREMKLLPPENKFTGSFTVTRHTLNTIFGIDGRTVLTLLQQVKKNNVGIPSEWYLYCRAGLCCQGPKVPQGRDGEVTVGVEGAYAYMLVFS